jgi:hypothetical protein
MRSYETATFRFNPDLELVLFDRLDTTLQARLSDLSRDPSFYGILRLANRALEASAAAPLTTTRPVDRETALLLLTLRTPGPLPQYARRLLGRDGGHAITNLVLDAVLEIEFAGAFRSGPTAIDALSQEWPELGLDLRGVEGEDEPPGLVARLSIHALRHAARLPIDDVAALAGRLYRYNRLPLSPSAATDRDARSVSDADRLGLAGPDIATALERGWVCTDSSATDGWMSWGPRAAVQPTATLRGTVKLYVSPLPAAVPATLAASIAAATEHRALALKVGTGPYGLLRPDKLVIYFAHREHLQAAAARLATALDGVPAHGVPFTVAVTDDGLLSWGADPPTHAGGRGDWVGRTGTESWRSWLTTQLAAAIVAGRQGNDPAASERSAVRFALRRAAALQVDPVTWTPADTLWDEGEQEALEAGGGEVS